MKKKLLIFAILLSCLLLGNTAPLFAETQTTNVLQKGADSVFEMNYQYATRNSDNSWPTDPDNWTAADFDDSSWSTKKVPFGSDLSGDQKWEGEYNCYWLRKKVDFGTIDSKAQYYIICRHDDTYKMYVNGTEVVNRQGWSGNNYSWVAIPSSCLNDGENTIAVYIQQNYGGSYFDMGIKKVIYDLSSPYAGEIPETGNDYYLYNPKSGLWLQNNDRISSDWNTRAELGTRGLDFKLNYQETGDGGNNAGGWYINGKFNESGCVTINAGNRYLDTSAKDAWHLTNVNVPGITNAYTIIWYPTSQDDYILSATEDASRTNKSNNLFTPTDNNYFLDTKRDAIQDGSIWVLVTKEQRLAMMNTGTTAAPQDATWLIKNPDLSDVDDRRSAWTESHQNGEAKYNARNDDNSTRNGRVYEFFNNDNFTFKQTISDLPAGKYHMKVQGFYRGAEAKMYAGSKEQALTSASTTEDIWTVARAMYNNGSYIGDWMEFTHAGGNLEIGVKKTSKDSDTDWVVFSKFKLEYLGGAEQHDILEAAINYMEERGYTETDDARTTLGNSWDPAELTNALNALKLRFKQFVAEKSVKPTIFTNAATAVVGTDNNEYGVVTEDQADGFYLYNVGTGRWFCGGADWGAHAAVGFPGIKVTTPKNNYGSGQYNSIKTWLFNGDWNNGGLLNNSGYCDTGGNGWKFWTKDASQGIYTISRNGDQSGDNSYSECGTKQLLGFNPNTIMEVLTDKTGADDPNNQWIFVTEAQRDQMAKAAIATASSDNPVDFTYKIGMPGFNQRERVAGTNQSNETLPWICNHENYTYTDLTYDYNDIDNDRHIICDRGRNHNDFCVDIYGWSWQDSFSLKQTITGLTPGRYRVKVQGYNNGGEDYQKAMLVVNGDSYPLRERDSETELPWQGYANTTWEAIEYFQNGLYWNEMEYTVGEDGELTIGIESPRINDDMVVLFDNFRLEYIGGVDVIVGNAGYATFIAPFNIGSIPESLEAYAAQVETDHVHLEPVSQIPAGEAVVLKNEGVYTFTYSFGSVTLGTTNDLLPATQVIQCDGTQYVLAKKNDVVGFYKAETDGYINEGKGYLKIPSSTKAFYTFGEDEDANSIEAIEAIPAGAEIYNLAGQRLTQPAKGVNIIGGKKYVVK